MSDLSDAVSSYIWASAHGRGANDARAHLRRHVDRAERIETALTEIRDTIDTLIPNNERQRVDRARVFGFIAAALTPVTEGVTDPK